MLARIWSASLFGINAVKVGVEVDVSGGLPGIVVVGLPDTAVQEIIVRPEFTFYIPNAFTPDGDGKNDVFNGNGTNIAEYEMLIFNRWGELVFSTNSLDYSWDGTYKASPEPKIDVYVYKVKIKDSVRGEYHLYEGHVTIVR